MPLVIDHDVEIAAPADVVWGVITDLRAYPEWNPFVVSCTSSLAVGEPIHMRVKLFAFAQPQRETILEHVPGRRLCYGLPGDALGTLASRRCHEVEALGPARTAYRSRFALSGRLAVVVRGLMGTRLQRGFGSMTDAIKRRAESR